MPKLTLRLLFELYRKLLFFVKWDNVISGHFNEVCQERVLSPKLGNVFFIHDLTDMLRSVNLDISTCIDENTF